MKKIIIITFDLMEDVELMRYCQMVLQLNVIPLESTFVVQNMVTVEILISIVTVQIVLITGTRMPKVTIFYIVVSI